MASEANEKKNEKKNTKRNKKKKVKEIYTKTFAQRYTRSDDSPEPVDGYSSNPANG